MFEEYIGKTVFFYTIDKCQRYLMTITNVDKELGDVYGFGISWFKYDDGGCNVGFDGIVVFHINDVDMSTFKIIENEQDFDLKANSMFMSAQNISTEMFKKWSSVKNKNC